MSIDVGIDKVGQKVYDEVKPVATETVGGIEYQHMVSGLVPFPYDYYAITYVASGNGVGEVETITYKTGGALGTTVATVTYTYDASNNLSTVTRV